LIEPKGDGVTLPTSHGTLGRTELVGQLLLRQPGLLAGLGQALAKDRSGFVGGSSWLHE
jgi:hypothetical protein